MLAVDAVAVELASRLDAGGAALVVLPSMPWPSSGTPASTEQQVLCQPAAIVAVITSVAGGATPDPLGVHPRSTGGPHPTHGGATLANPKSAAHNRDRAAIPILPRRGT